jgi:hypothetical protein
MYIQFSELKERIKNGDLVFVKYKDRETDEGHSGWRMYVNKSTAGIDSKVAGSWSSGFIQENNTVLRYIPLEEVNNLHKLATFFHDTDVTSGLPVYDVLYKSEKEIELESLIRKLQNELTTAQIKLANIKQGED